MYSQPFKLPLECSSRSNVVADSEAKVKVVLVPLRNLSLCRTVYRAKAIGTFLYRDLELNKARPSVGGRGAFSLIWP